MLVGEEVEIGKTEEEMKSECLYAQVIKLKERLFEKDKEISRLQRETHKLRSVIEKAELARVPSLSLSSLQPGSSGQPTKKCGVSGESWGEESGPLKERSERHEKDFRARQLMRAALGDNDFLKNLDVEQMRDIIDFMHLEYFKPGAFVIREGETGSHLYVSAEGQLEVSQDGRILGTLGPRKAFGELAILYNCKRTASVRAITECKVWALERRAFQMAMVRAGMQRMEDRLAFLRSVPLLRELKTSSLARIADCLEVEHYPTGSYIIREGAVGDTFFIISEGRVEVTMAVYSEDTGEVKMEVLRELGHGDYFGEQALLREERRSANVVSLQPGVECLTLDRESFIQLIGDLSAFQTHQLSYLENLSSAEFELEENQRRKKSLSDTEGPSVGSYGSTGIQLGIIASSLPKDVPFSVEEAIELGEGRNFLSLPEPYSQKEREDALGLELECKRLRLDDLEVIATLGVGGFGRVELVQVSYSPNRVFALKCLPKAHIKATQQQEHVYAEKNIMISCKSPFIARLYTTFKDSKCIYLLMEACLGGEVWTILRDKGSFDEDTARFVAACVVLAMEYLHEKNIVYRDLKPENLMIANDGIVKLVAPEVILNRGHDRTVDFWALGVLLFELLTGLPPWGPMSAEASIGLGGDNSDPLTTYNQILKGTESLNFPKNLSRGGSSLIRRLCRQVPGERLGAQRGIRDIMVHRWFQGFDWEGLKMRKLKPPLKPRLRSPTDITNFDKFELEIPDTPDDFSGWDAEF